MLDFKHILALIQIPIISLIVYFCYSAYKEHKFSNLRYIGIGWTFNLLYAVWTALNFAPDTKWYFFIVTCVDLITSYFILIGSRAKYTKLNLLYRVVPNDKFVLTYLYVIALVLNVICLNVIFFKFITIILNTWLLGVSFYFFYEYTIILNRKYNIGIVIVIGSFLFCVIQLFPLIIYLFDGIKNHLNTIGFAIGLISKVLICVGMHKFLIKLVEGLKKDSGLSERLKKNIDRVIHELQKPGDNLYQGVSHILSNEKKYRLTKGMVSQLETLEESVEHINVIIASSRKLIYEPDTLNFAVRQFTKDYKEYNFNVIIKTAINITKNNLSKIDKRSPKFNEGFTPKPIVYCNFSDILQITLNLLKNATESIEKEEKRTGLIVVTTKKDKKSNGIILQIDDDGVSIDENILNQVFIEGFSTKSKEYDFKGYGLTIVKEIVDFYNGKINIKPKNNGIGTSVIVTIPYNFEKSSTNE